MRRWGNNCCIWVMDIFPLSHFRMNNFEPSPCLLGANKNLSDLTLWRATFMQRLLPWKDQFCDHQLRRNYYDIRRESEFWLNNSKAKSSLEKWHTGKSWRSWEQFKNSFVGWLSPMTELLQSSQVQEITEESWSLHLLQEFFTSLSSTLPHTTICGMKRHFQSLFQVLHLVLLAQF